MIKIHADRSRRALVHSAQLSWMPSPHAGVDRRLLERIGNEVALATSIVRYGPDTRFSAHTHELGEEFLVLEGIFSDEQGDYPVGTYVRNPPGSSHAPFSHAGCVIFVKLRQMAIDETESVTSYGDGREWFSEGTPGVERCQLYANDRLSVELVRIKAGSELPIRQHDRGEEVFVIEGSVNWCDESLTVLEKWSWLRHPGSNHCAILAQRNSVLWIKRGHL